MHAHDTNDHGDAPNRLARFAVALPGAMLLAALTAGPVLAQDTAQDTTQPPATEAETDTGTTPPGGLDLDFSEVCDDEGNCQWTVETDPVNTAEEEPETPVVDEEVPVLNGTGSNSTPTTNGSDPANGAASDGDGANSNLFLIIGAVLIFAAVVTGLLFVIRRRRNAEDLDVVEDPIIPLVGEDGFVAPAPAYAGAADAGAYEAGGAAYAQHTDATGTIVGEAEGADGRLAGIHRSMVNMADKGLADSGKATIVAQKLEAIGSQMRPGEWLVMAAGATIGAFFVMTFLMGVIFGILVSALTALGFWMYLDFKASQREKAFAEDLPETLQLIAGSLRGGMSMIQAVQNVADEADDPTAGEFQRVVTEVRLGRDLAQSFHDMSARMGSKDFEWVVTAIDIHREVGGDLASIMDRVGNTIRARNRVRGQVAALSAEGKLSGLILFLLPPVMLLLIALMNPTYLGEMTETGTGQIMMAISAVMLCVGGVWLKRLARFVY